MFDHHAIWNAIDSLAKSKGYSASGLAKKAGLDSTTFNKSKRSAANGKQRWPSTESISKILAVTDTKVHEFLTFLDPEDPANKNTKQAQNSIPLLGFLQAREPSHFDKKGYPLTDVWDYFEMPMSTEHSEDGVFALQIAGNDFEPIYKQSDIVIVCPSSPIRPGDRVVIKTIAGELTIKEIGSLTPERVCLKPLNEDQEEYDIPTDSVVWASRVIWASQ